MMSMAKKVDPMEAAAKRAAEEVTKKAKAAKQAADAAKTKSKLYNKLKILLI